MEAVIAVAAGACAPGCAGLIAAAGMPMVTIVGIAGAVGLALLRSRNAPEEPQPDKTMQADEPTSTGDFL